MRAILPSQNTARQAEPTARICPVSPSETRPATRLSFGTIRLPEVGCGVGQILPVVVQCLAAKPGTTILLEQPEIHLHQKLQANLCDFFIAQMRRGVRMVVETHSEILVQRLRRRIAEDGSAFIQKNAKVLFIPNDAPECIEIPIDTSGNVGQWPESFFDQGMSEMQALAKAQQARRENNT